MSGDRETSGGKKRVSVGNEPQQEVLDSWKRAVAGNE